MMTCVFDIVCTGSHKSVLLRSNVLTKEEEELNNESHDNHVTLSLGSLLQPKLITMSQ